MICSDKYRNIILKLFAIFYLCVITSCDKFVDIDPPTSQIISDAVFTNDKTATSALIGIYSEMMGVYGSVFSNGDMSSVTVLAGLSADELIDYQNIESATQFYTNSILPTNSYLTVSLWGSTFKSIYYVNSLLEGLAKSNSITEATRKRLEGEAKFIRGFCNFYLVNLFGRVPIVLTTDYRINNAISRADIPAVYEQIENDLMEAKELLTESYPTAERIRANKYVAMAMLARVYLFQGKWEKAELEANEVINSGTYVLPDNLNEVFLKESSEAIWQLKPMGESIYYPNESSTFIFENTPTIVSLTPQLKQSFEPADARDALWIVVADVAQEYYYPHKYIIPENVTSPIQYSIVLRLAEQYLISAEAKAQQENLAGAIADLDKIRKRAGLPLIADTDPGIGQQDLLDAIQHERRVELFTEWGHRWLDLKRTGKAGEVISAIKPGLWQDTDVLYPIPQTERDNNPNLGQNTGY